LEAAEPCQQMPQASQLRSFNVCLLAKFDRANHWFCAFCRSIIKSGNVSKSVILLSMDICMQLMDMHFSTAGSISLTGRNLEVFRQKYLELQGFFHLIPPF
jgi:hypothetical protein